MRMPVVTAVGRRRGFAMPWVSTARSGAVMLANYSAGVCGRVSSPGLNVRKMCLKANTPGAVTWLDTPKRFLSTQTASRCMAVNSSDVVTGRIDPQVLHTPLNTDVDGYATCDAQLHKQWPLGVLASNV